jgi:hypothetical protein
MVSPINQYTRYLKLGAVAVAIHCPNAAFADEACEHIFLSDRFEGPTVAEIRYTHDDSAADQFSAQCKDNVVYINRSQMDDGHERIVLGMFNAFTAVLEVRVNNVVVRYPSHAPVRLLLDDVFQAALQPVLDHLDGFILHGACMVRDNKAIVLMGNSGSGKSTTAYNLTRFGFSGYADDAVLVTPHDGKLTVWPLTRELSLRPLSFRLFQQQGIALGTYKKDGDKYYFPQSTQTRTGGAALEHICFLDLSGEAQTQITALNVEQTHEILTANNRHFSFMGRSDATKYARTLAQGVPAPLHALLGTDLDYQGAMYDRLFTGRKLEMAGQKRLEGRVSTRSQKSALIRQAWSSPNHEPLQQLIPLLGDFDPQIFKLALGFFQTLPMAGLLPLAVPDHNMPILEKDQAPWLRAVEWRQGCKTLLEQSGIEVLQRFAFSWIKSAPLLYPFLKVALAEERFASEPLTQAWVRYCAQINNGENDPACDQMHLLGFQNGSVWDSSEATAWWRHQFSTNRPQLQLYCWVVEGGRTDWRRLIARLENLPQVSKITIVPVLGANDAIESAMDFVQGARAQGIAAVLCRQVPLCRLTDAHAHFLLDAGALDPKVDQGKGKVRFFNQPGEPQAEVTNDNEFGIPWTDTFVRFDTHPYDECHSCHLASLGLCRGGFFAIS